MAPTRGAPARCSSWRRPYTCMYNDNYRYGTGLYSDTLTDIEKRYSDSLSRTQLRSDRRDLNFETFAGSGLGSAAEPGRRTTPDPPRSTITSPDPEDVIPDLLRKSHRRQARPLSDLYEEWSAIKPTNSPSLTTLRPSKSTSASFLPSVDNGPVSSSWRQKSRVLQEEMESLENNMTQCEKKLQSELFSLKSRNQSEVGDLTNAVELTAQQVQDLQRLCKRQATQIHGLQSAYDESQNHIQDSLDEVSLWQNRCRSLKKDMERLRTEMEQAIVKVGSKRDD